MVEKANTENQIKLYFQKMARGAENTERNNIRKYIDNLE